MKDDIKATDMQNTLHTLFKKIESLTDKERLIIAIDGGSASGKTTLSGVLFERYKCNVIHMDDFFLRPEQRTPQRYKQPGGNVDRERFANEILSPLLKNERIVYRPFDCKTQMLKKEIQLQPKRITIIEGAYSMHPNFEHYYDFSVFLDIDKDFQKKRILKRNTPSIAKRFFEEWIPLENLYFSEFKIKENADCVTYIREER